MTASFPPDIRDFVQSATWRFATTYASTWPHEYVVRTLSNAEMITALARHISEHGQDEDFYAQTYRYFHEDGMVYWFMDPRPESASLINRCSEGDTYEARLAAGTLPPQHNSTTEFPS